MLIARVQRGIARMVFHIGLIMDKLLLRQLRHCVLKGGIQSSCGCGGDDDEEETDEDDDDQLVEYTCPHCGNEVTFEIDGFDLEEENLCPACGKPLFPIDGEDDENSDQK